MIASEVVSSLVACESLSGSLKEGDGAIGVASLISDDAPGLFISIGPGLVSDDCSASDSVVTCASCCCSGKEDGFTVL